VRRTLRAKPLALGYTRKSHGGIGRITLRVSLVMIAFRKVGTLRVGVAAGSRPLKRTSNAPGAIRLEPLDGITEGVEVLPEDRAQSYRHPERPSFPPLMKHGFADLTVDRSIEPLVPAHVMKRPFHREQS
jgi:hypothetical protein